MKQAAAVKPDMEAGGFIELSPGYVRDLRLLAGIWMGITLLIVVLWSVLPARLSPLAVYAGAGANFVCLVRLWVVMHRITSLEHSFSALVSRAGDLAWGTDSRLLIKGVWGAAVPVTGQIARELKGRPFTDILSGEDAKKFASSVRRNRPFSMTVRLSLAGSRPEAEIIAVPLSGEYAWQGTIRDISGSAGLKLANAVLEEKLAKAEKLKNLGLLAGSVAHDLNNILSGIATYPEVLLMDTALDPKIRQGLGMIKDSGRKASSVVSDLLTISRGIKADKQILNINKVIERYMAAAEFQKIRRTYDQVEIRVMPEPELLNISGSYIHIEKAMMNLVLNAVEETADRPGGRVVLSTANYYVDESPEARDRGDLAPGEYVVLTVADNGAGIPKECMDKIYEPFFTQKEMGRSGTGLGLTVVLNAVQDHNGVIRLHSDAGGTRFNLFFPAIRVALPTGDDPGSLAEIRGRGETLLIVDDLASQRKIAATILTNLGYRVFSVDNGRAAVEFAKNNPVDLLVLDMIMAPGISGLETYEQIRRICPDQKAIIASGHSESEDVLKAQELGAGSFVKKPYTILDMGIAVKEELEK